MAFVLDNGPMVPVERAWDDLADRTWPVPQPAAGIPVPVDKFLCLPPRRPDGYGPDGSPWWTKSAPGGPVMTGPGGTVVASTPQLPVTPTGFPTNGGEVLGARAEAARPVTGGGILAVIALVVAAVAMTRGGR